MPVISGMRWSTTNSATGSPRTGQLADDLERLVARAGADDPVVVAVARAQVALDRAEDREASSSTARIAGLAAMAASVRLCACCGSSSPS